VEAVAQEQAQSRGPRRARGSVSRNRLGNGQVRWSELSGERRAAGAFFFAQRLRRTASSRFDAISFRARSASSKQVTPTVRASSSMSAAKQPPKRHGHSDIISIRLLFSEWRHSRLRKEVKTRKVNDSFFESVRRGVSTSRFCGWPRCGGRVTYCSEG